MAEQQIQAHKVTKPIQLLAAWLVGLILINTIFLTAAVKFDISSWECSALVISAIVNVPLFLGALFILQTRFRAELQEDTFYSEYLSKKTATVVRIDKNASQDSRFEEIERQLEKLAAPRSVLCTSNSSGEIDWSDWAIALNDLHPKFLEIREAMRTANIPLSDIFGGVNNSPMPSKWIISLSHHLPIAHKARLLEILLPFGFDGIVLWEPCRDADENEDVYIGSYGSATCACVTPELFELVQKKIDAADLIHYIKKHEFKYID